MKLDIILHELKWCKRISRSELQDGKTIKHDDEGNPLSEEEQEDENEKMEISRLFAKNAKYFADEELEKCLYFHKFY